LPWLCFRGSMGLLSGDLKKVAAIIPAYNEELTIGKTISAIRESGINKIVIIDDGSSDGTWQQIKEAGVKGIRFPTNMGKTAALACGVAGTTEEVLLFCDADLQESAVHLKKLLEPVFRGQADMVIAAWPQSNRGGFGLVKAIAGWAIKKSTGMKTRSPLSGQRALRRRVWEMRLKAVGFGVETALTIDALKNGFKVQEMELPLVHRELGKTLSGFIHRARQLTDVLKSLWIRREWLLPSKG
jgi:glycosyltransferase involved in cell wall biosynthesis